MSNRALETRIPLSDRVLLATDDGAAMTGLGRSKFLELVYSGDIESVKVGRRRLVPRAAIDRFVESLRATS